MLRNELAVLQDETRTFLDQLYGYDGMRHVPKALGLYQHASNERTGRVRTVALFFVRVLVRCLTADQADEIIALLEEDYEAAHGDRSEGVGFHEALHELDGHDCTEDRERFVAALRSGDPDIIDGWVTANRKYSVKATRARIVGSRHAAELRRQQAREGRKPARSTWRYGSERGVA